MLCHDAAVCAELLGGSNASFKVNAVSLMMDAMSEMMSDILIATDIVEETDGIVTVSFPEDLGVPP